MPANAYALCAIALWSTLALLGVWLRHVPPFLLTGLGLVVGGAVALPFVIRDPRKWRIPRMTLALGIYGLFGYHLLLFVALRSAPPVEANLINYLWPLLMVLLAPALLGGPRLRTPQVLAALLGFAGAALAILGGNDRAQLAAGGLQWGYLAALAAAFVWASYSLLTRRVAAFATPAVGLFGLVSGALSLLCHFSLEPAVSLSAADCLLILLMGLGPLGAAFFFWDKALKVGDARQIALLSYITPLGSTALLMLAGQRAVSWHIALAAAMILGAALPGSWRTRTK